MKSYVILTGAIERKKSLDFLCDLYKVNRFNHENRRFLSKCVRWNMLIAKILTTVFSITAAAVICTPLAIFFITGRMEPILPFYYIPYIPTDQLWGYAFYCIYISTGIIICYCGTLATDALLLTSTMHIWPMANIVEQAVNGLNQATGSFREQAVRNSTWLHRRVRNIVLMHKEIYLWVFYPYL